MIINRLYWFVTDAKYRIFILDYFGVAKLISDRLYLKLLFKAYHGYKLDLNNPKSFNEKLQWLKINDRNPNYTKMVDKYEAKKYVSSLIGSNHIIPTLGVWDNYDEINFDCLPNDFVLKCTHDSGSVIICKNKKDFDYDKAKLIINNSLKKNYYYCGREWPYKNVKPRVIAEKYMADESQSELKDYKFFCFDGIPKYIQVDYNRFTDHKRNIYSTKWKYMGFTSLYPTDENHIIEKPQCLEEMLDIARILSKGIPHVRVDLYVVDNKVYFGELTFYHGSGLEKYYPPEWDKRLGDLITIV